MTTERLGASRVIRLGNTVIEVRAVYPSQDEDADPVGYHVDVYQRTTSVAMTLEEVRALLAAFGGVPNLWS